jgi:hypothetical protein
MLGAGAWWAARERGDCCTSTGLNYSDGTGLDWTDKLARYEYVRSFEQSDVLLANTWIVVRIDGRGFSKYVFFLFSSTSQDPFSLETFFPTSHPFFHSSTWAVVVWLFWARSVSLQGLPSPHIADMILRISSDCFASLMVAQIHHKVPVRQAK